MLLLLVLFIILKINPVFKILYDKILQFVTIQAILYKKYSSASDVWSYGCVMYEIWSVGHKPFENNTNQEVSNHN